MQRNYSKIFNILEIVNEYDLLIFDLWGVIINVAEPYEGVVDVVNEIIEQKDVLFMSNASQIDRSDLLKSFGINLKPNTLITAGQVAYEFMQNQIKGESPLKVYHLGGLDFSVSKLSYSDWYGNLNIEIVKDIKEADLLNIALHTDSSEITSEIHNIFKYSIENNIPTLCANPDKTVPKFDKLGYCAGYFAQEYENMGGRVIYAGKPKPEIFEFGLRKFPNIDKNRVIMIGDTLQTDIIGANGVGIHSGLVDTGHTKTFTLECQNDEERIEKLQKIFQEKNIWPNKIVRLV